LFTIGPQPAQVAETDIGAVGLDHEAGDRRDPAQPLRRRRVAHLRAKSINVFSDAGVHALVSSWRRLSSLATPRASVTPKRLRTRQSPGFRTSSIVTLRLGKWPRHEGSSRSSTAASRGPT